MPRQAGSSQGTIYYDKNKKKYVSQYYDYDYNTKQRIKKSKRFKTEDEAKKYLDSIMYQKSNSLYIEHNGIPLIELMKANVKFKLDTNQVSEMQDRRLMATIKNIAKSEITKKRIEEITPEEIQYYLNSIKYYSNSVIRKIFEQFTQSYRYAMNRGYITKNPMVNVIKPKSDKLDKQVRALTTDEQKAFVEWLLQQNLKSCPYKNVYLMQMFMGFRVGEVLALKNSDIDLAHGMVNVDKTLTFDINGNSVMGRQTKTFAGMRTLPIPQMLYQYFVEQMKSSSEKENPLNLLFNPPLGTYTNSHHVNDMLKKYLKNLEITGITTHSLRHTYGTRCIEGGMEPVVLQRLMGHKNITVTLNTYTSVFTKYKESQIDKVNNYILDESLFPTNNAINTKDDDIIKIVNTLELNKSENDNNSNEKNKDNNIER